MPATAANLIQRTRRFMRDWPDQDAITASCTSSSTSISVATDATTRYGANWPIEIDNETMIVRSTAATTLTVERGAFGSTAATHAISAPILVRPAFYAVEILDQLNDAIQACYPTVYKEVLDTSLTVTATAYEYTVPNMPGTYGSDTIQIPRLRMLEIQYASTEPYVELRAWNVRRGATAKLKLTYLEAAGATLRLRGYGPFPDLALADSLDAQWPKNFIQPLVERAGSSLLASGEAGRSRIDVGARDDRESAVRAGAAMSAAQNIEGRFARRLATVAFAPMQPHTVTHE